MTDLEPFNPPFPSGPAPRSPIFDPPEDRIPQVLEHLDSPMASLYMVAQANNTTLEALSLWLTRPDIQARNATIDSAAAGRNRSLATRNLRRVIAVLSQTIERCTEEDRHQAFSSAPKASLARTRSRELSRKAGNLLLQIVRLDPSNPCPPAPASARKPHPAPRAASQHNRIARLFEDMEPRQSSAPEVPRIQPHPPAQRCLYAPAPSKLNGRTQTPASLIAAAGKSPFKTSQDQPASGQCAFGTRARGSPSARWAPTDPSD